MITFERAVVASILLHVLILAAFSITARRNFNMPESIYQVNLITDQQEGPPAAPKAEQKQTDFPAQPKPAMTLPQPKPRPEVKPTSPAPGYDQSKQEDKQDQEELRDQLAYLGGLDAVKHRVKIRISGGATQNANGQSSHPGKSNPTLVNAYSGRLSALIQKYLYFPQARRGDLETTVTITILNDGTLVLKDIEQSSGNPKYDDAVIAAVKRTGSEAGPPPPGLDTTIGLRVSLE